MVELNSGSSTTAWSSPSRTSNPNATHYITAAAEEELSSPTCALVNKVCACQVGGGVQKIDPTIDPDDFSALRPPTKAGVIVLS